MTIFFQKELEKIKKLILSLGVMVEERMRLAIQAIETGDTDVAATIIKSDYEIDEKEVEVEDACLKIITLYQPVAVDLRFLIAVIKINNDLERIADEAVNIAERVANITGKQDDGFRFDYAPMAEIVEDMLKKSLDALVNLDVDMAFRVVTLDDDVDDLHATAYDLIKTEMQKTPDKAGSLINLYLISRHLERIADHATNIAEEVIHLVEGEIVRHGNY
jgi:phosphate transport system protein